MILALAAKGKKTIACTMLALMYFEMVVPPFALGTSRARSVANVKVGNYTVSGIPSGTPDKAITPGSIKAVATVPPKAETLRGGPTQPEAQEFHSVSDANMVNLFTGDFSYNIPLMDVGGYPVALGYNSGITMDQEASWVGLGWNINPGTISRNMRGLPDDFNGTDSVTKSLSVKMNKTIGVTQGGDVELGGMPIGVGLGYSTGFFHNTYRGFGIEYGLNASVSAGAKGAGSLTAGLSINNNTQEGLTISPSLSVSAQMSENGDKGGYSGNLSTSLSYNTRSGMKALQFSGGVNYSRTIDKGKKTEHNQGASRSAVLGGLSYAYPTYTPTITVPYTSEMFTVTGKLGYDYKIVHPSAFLSGYITKQWIADEDKRVKLPAYGYLNYSNGGSNPAALLDFNREKESVYREKPTLPNIAVPSYTYDVFSISGEGIGGSFRAYRGDIGYVYDHRMKTKDRSLNFSGDLGFGDIIHAGTDLSYTRAYTESGPWTQSNPLAATVAFTQPSGLYESVYFRDPGEKAANAFGYYEGLGGDDIVIPKLYQKGDNTPGISTLNALTRYKDGKKLGDVNLDQYTVTKYDRDKRTQVISYLTAKEASVAGLSTYIENYGLNKYILQNCLTSFPDNIDGDSTGLKVEYFKDRDLKQILLVGVDTNAHFYSYEQLRDSRPNFGLPNQFSVRWTGRIKAPVTGIYKVKTITDDGVRVFINDSSIINGWKGLGENNKTVNLEAGEIYTLRVEYFNYTGPAYCHLWMISGADTIQKKDLFMPAVEHDNMEVVKGVFNKEKRINSFRKGNHISEIDVLNTEGKRYIYGLPVYNMSQKEMTFAVAHGNGNAETGEVSYTDGSENSVKNDKGTDHYFSSEEVPAYAHSFLLTGILSSDYVDLTGNGISDDDAGSSVKFNYTKVAGKDSAFAWRTPYSDKATYNEGLKSDTRDDKGSYVSGTKELWYLNSIVSKNMIATFKLGERYDQQPINEQGYKKQGKNPSKRLEEINLYTKADFMKKGTNATPIKTVHFEYTYELCAGYNTNRQDSSGKLTLKRVWFTYNGNNKSKKNAYVFNYNSKNPSYDHKSFDRWGNYKDPAQNPNATTANKITNAEHPYALQDSTLAAANAAAWTLDSIVLPSGGRMKITYESDDYAYVQNKRAAQMFNVAGFSFKAPEVMGDLTNSMYDKVDPLTLKDKLYVGVNVPVAVTSKQDAYNKYLYGLDTVIHMRLNVKMPSDKFGNGYEFVPCYARLVRDEFGFLNGGKTIWFRVISIDGSGAPGGEYSPMAKAAAQFLRLNLPSKAYPGSDIGDDLDLVSGVRLMAGLAGNIKNALKSFDESVRVQRWAKDVDLTRSYVRLASPMYKKYGNGLRVKRVVIYDNWNAMTNKTKKESTYGTEYEYTTIKNINGVNRLISSGVATYEPILGGEENPLHIPIEYSEQSAALAPVNMGYVETPMTESFYPSPSVGYSVVRTRSINIKNTRSANGFEESHFYTAYDFPTISEYSLLDNDTKRRYKPGLANFLRINAKHHLVMSQGFKVELNDMHGQQKAHYVYSETDSIGQPSSATINYYHVDDLNAEFKHLNNNVLAMDNWGGIYSNTIGKDMELMMDMRQQLSSSNNINAQLNGEVFTVPPPVFIFGIGTAIVLPQNEETLFRSAAATKVITRHGIIDSVVVIDKGSKVSTKNLLYDGETGEPMLTATQNEFGNDIYQFNYPAGRAYDGMSGAYKNIGAVINADVTRGKLTNVGWDVMNTHFSAGDEVLVYARNAVEDDGCSPSALASFRNSGKKVWVVDGNALQEGASPDMYFVNEDGSLYTGSDVTLKVIRSGRRNISASAGSVTMMKNPLEFDGEGGAYLLIDKTKGIINASVVEYKQNWQVEDKKKQKIICAY